MAYLRMDKKNWILRSHGETYSENERVVYFRSKEKAKRKADELWRVKGEDWRVSINWRS